MSRIAIIGAGCAGLAAAAILCQHGLKVSVFEAAPQPGGRARKVDYRGLALDNGQHILLGAYSETLALLTLAGVDMAQHIERIPLTMHMLDIQKQTQLSLKTWRHLPAPLHLLAGLLCAQGLSAKEKWLAIRMMAGLQLSQFKLQQDLALAEFLKQQKQSARLIEFLWEPLCLAALNTPLASASSQVFLNVLRDSFAQRKADSDMLLAKVDLSTLLADPVSRYILAQGGEIQNATITQIEAADTGYLLTTGTQPIPFSHVIIAVAPHQLAHIAPAPLAHLSRHFSYQAITTVYLQYQPEAKLPYPIQGMVGTLSQWVFDRGQVCAQAGLIAVVISATGEHSAMPQAELAEKIAAELRLAFPTLAKPIWHKVITEKRATFSCDAGLQRPSNITPLNHLYLAGDYTAGDYPATIEGAVRSGVQCASYILQTLKN
jgi:hydroxysqualene dehydroxylase